MAYTHPRYVLAPQSAPDSFVVIVLLTIVEVPSRGALLSIAQHGTPMSQLLCNLVLNITFTNKQKNYPRNLLMGPKDASCNSLQSAINIRRWTNFLCGTVMAILRSRLGLLGPFLVELPLFGYRRVLNQNLRINSNLYNNYREIIHFDPWSDLPYVSYVRSAQICFRMRCILKLGSLTLLYRTQSTK